MREELVEIYSGASNAVVLRHPERKFPGILLQGDILHSICQSIDIALKNLDHSSLAYEELNEIRNSLCSLKNHYKSVLIEHKLPIPFSED